MGLFDESDLSIRGLNTLKSCTKVYAEFYTNPVEINKQKLEKLIGNTIIFLNRTELETKSNEILENAKKEKVALLVPGDCFTATTHISLKLQAQKENINVKVIHNSSIITAVCETGLQIYKFGRIVTLVFSDDGFLVETPYNVIKENFSRGLHTLLLLDYKFEEKKSMTINEGIHYLLKIENKRKEGVIKKEMVGVGIARIGSDNFIIKSDKINTLMNINFGSTPHCIIIPGNLHFLEKESLEFYN